MTADHFHRHPISCRECEIWCYVLDCKQTEEVPVENCKATFVRVFAL